jgi:NADH:ubiquinone oxidoreductase subunit 4 (subunit M)
MGEPAPALRGIRLDLRIHEAATLFPLVLLSLAIGLYPDIVLSFLRGSVANLLAASLKNAGGI